MTGDVHTDVLRHRAETKEGFAEVTADLSQVKADVAALRQLIEDRLPPRDA